MKCPFKLNVPVEIRTDEECDPDCAWLVTAFMNNCAECAIAVIAASRTESMGFMPENNMERDAS